MIAMFLFYNQARGKQLAWCIGSQYKHCHVMIYDGDMLLLVESQPYGIGFQRVKIDDIAQAQRNLKCIKSLISIVTVWVDKPKKLIWWPLWWRSCNNLARYASSVDIGFTLNPRHLYKKLLEYNNKRNYEILYHWSKENGL